MLNSTIILSAMSPRSITEDFRALIRIDQDEEGETFAIQ